MGGHGRPTPLTPWTHCSERTESRKRADRTAKLGQNPPRAQTMHGPTYAGVRQKAASFTGDCPDFRGAVEIAPPTRIIAAKMGLSPLRRVKGTGPCFRPTLLSPNTISRRKMDQSPTGVRRRPRTCRCPRRSTRQARYAGRKTPSSCPRNRRGRTPHRSVWSVPRCPHPLPLSQRARRHRTVPHDPRRVGEVYLCTLSQTRALPVNPDAASAVTV